MDIDLLDTIRAMSPGGMPGAVGNRSAACGTEGRPSQVARKKHYRLGLPVDSCFFFPLVNSLLGELLCFMLMKQLCIDHSML